MAVLLLDSGVVLVSYTLVLVTHTLVKGVHQPLEADEKVLNRVFLPGRRICVVSAIKVEDQLQTFSDKAQLTFFLLMTSLSFVGEIIA